MKQVQSGSSEQILCQRKSNEIDCRVVGLGGLGHLAVRFARALGAHVTVLGLDKSQNDEALRLGAHRFFVSTDVDQLEQTLDLIIDTVPVDHDLTSLLNLLRFNGVLCMFNTNLFVFVQTTRFDSLDVQGLAFRQRRCSSSQWTWPSNDCRLSEL